jgi:hypothetical protein
VGSSLFDRALDADDLAIELRDRLGGEELLLTDPTPDPSWSEVVTIVEDVA